MLSLLLLSSCTNSANHYQQTIHSWRNGNVNTLLKRWGRPDEKTVNSNGNLTLVYYTRSYKRANGGPISPMVGVNVNKQGRPTITTIPNTSRSWSRESTSLNCMAVFETNAKGMIISTNVVGSGCYGSESFEKRLTNPEQKPSFNN